jgi:hypothetical protein
VITANIQLILGITGALTAGAAGFFLFPRSLLQSLFGLEEIGQELTLMTRLLGLFLFLIGALLVNAAFDPGLRLSVVVAASLEKIVFAWLAFGGPLKKSGIARLAATGDSFMVLLYVGYLAGF